MNSVKSIKVPSKPFVLSSQNRIKASHEIDIHHRKKVVTYNALQMEREEHILQSEERYETFKDILYNQSREKISPKYLLYAFLGILPALASKWVYTLIPVHNVVLRSSYWYELPIQLIFGYLFVWTTYGIYTCSYLMNIKYIKKIRHAVILWLVMVVITITFFGALYVFWEEFLYYQYPVPMMGYTYLLLSIISILIAIWFRFPLEWIKQEEFRKRLLWFSLSFFIAQLVYFEYGLITKLLLTLPKNYIWIPALFLPVVKEFNCWIQTKMYKKSSDGDPSCVEITCTHGIALGHSFFLAYAIGTLATTTFSAVIIATDFFINLFRCLRIVYLKNKDESRENIEKQIEILQVLVISETNEFIAPLCYILCFMTAYFGPNSSLIGNIGNSYWQYSSVKNVAESIKFVVIFMFVDLGSLVVGSVMLWKKCRINLYRAFSALQKEFTGVFAASLAIAFNAVSMLSLF